MVLIKEFRIVMPMSLEEYEIAQAYTVIKLQQETATSTEGVDVLENQAFEDNVYGKGHYTSKVYRFQRFQLGLQVLHHPILSLCKRKLGMHIQDANQSPCFNKLVLTIETIHLADNGKSENVHGLNKQKLASRQVETIDIASSVRDCWSYLVGCCDADFSQFRSTMTGRGPLLEGWSERCSPVMTAYKLVTVDAPYWGFGKRLEQAIIAGERALFLESHRHCFAWIDDWYGMSGSQLLELEQDCCSSEGRRKPASLKSKEGGERR
ncbi:hypothetical protein V2J09_020853 [Rumex salicifolius]